jgi:tetratricopeptide (TPR) repeat protein
LREFWRAHTRLGPFVAAGRMDFGRFDVERDATLALDRSGTVLAPGTVKNPLVVIANYCFDSVAQDVFHFEKGQAFASTVTLSSPQPEPDLADAQLLNRLEIACDYQPVNGAYYQDPEWDALLDDYRHRLSNTNMLFPIAVLRGLRNLSRIAGGRMLLISGDKGISRAEDLLGRREPEIATHDGCFSLMVNYHALGQYVLNSGGQFLRTAHRQAHLDVCAFLWGAHPRGYAETRLAYADSIEHGGPDDFFVLKQALEQRYDQLSPDQVLAHLRLSGWDSAVFLGCMPALLAKAEGLPETARQELYWAAQQLWANYFPIGERLDVAFHIGMLLHALHYYLEAIEFFQRSVQLYGLTSSTAYDLGVCHYELQQLAEARAWADRALELDPEYEPAKTLRIRIESQLLRAAGTEALPA